MPKLDAEREDVHEGWDRFVRDQSSPRRIPEQLFAPNRPHCWRQILLPRWSRVPVPLALSVSLAVGTVLAWTSVDGRPPAENSGGAAEIAAVVLGMAHLVSLAWLSLRGPVVAMSLALVALLGWWTIPGDSTVILVLREFLGGAGSVALASSILGSLVIRFMQLPYWRWLSLLRHGKLVPAVVQSFHPASVADDRVWCMDIEFKIPNADVYGHLLANFPGWHADPDGLIRDGDGFTVRRGAKVEVLFDPEHPERFVVLPDSLTPQIH